MGTSMRSAFVALTTAIGTMAAFASAANAATPSNGNASGCYAAPQAPAAPASAAAVAAAAGYKASHDSEAATVRSLTAAGAAHDAQKRALLKSGKLELRSPKAKLSNCFQSSRSSSAVGYATVSWLSHYDQVRNSFCGPAVVAEVSATTPGSSPYNFDQYAAANYMAGSWTYIDQRGTNIDEEVNGLNYYVGVPDFGWNFYGFVGMDYTPTGAQRAAFEANLDADVAKGSPVAGDAWEVPGGPHLVGHPVGEEIFHYFQIGGRSGSQTYYSDSATSVWSSVPAYSWYDTYTLETILGGRGYIW